MSVAETYLDLVILINGGMDTLLLNVLGRLLNIRIRPSRILMAVLLGEIPVVLTGYSAPQWTVLIKWIIPFLMILVAFPTRRLNVFLKALTGFWLLSAGLGGFVYALWGWTQFDGGLGGERLTLVINNFWIIPLGAIGWWFLQRLWQRWQERKSILGRNIYDLEINFGGEEHGVVQIKALLDTGNHLRDPLTGSPVILLEEEVAVGAMPDNIRAFLDIPWKDYADPWPLLWKVNPILVKRLVFIPFQAIDSQSWLLGIRPERVTCFSNKGSRQIHATVALVRQVLSSEGEYQALLHPEHVQRGGD
ncbi:sigma-E processing peptidase SpoIIGA [Desulfosporosinus lacus]|uniref:Sporulation sigma-E factor-processing peptidase n=1 Tax=Desulfosporosinus lacus DSM 15449 TaxID=1121420 RepID=A0A1M5UMJ8_9FIRM|nr:sigma-E processing peptidase SpoIIGA [Desulfosporosinus lacus]SHH64088.1 stage II sporulation protein GA (sporulation sigma-E factor processing peptidase) [Desulfosporosinus lacus DSM 15449]